MQPGPPAGLPRPSSPPGRNGGAGRTAGRSQNPRRRTRRNLPAPSAAARTTCCRCPERRSIYTPGASRAAEPGWGWGTAREAPPHSARPRPPARAVRPTRGAGTPHSDRCPPLAARRGNGPKGGPPCGKRRHGRSCSVNESKRLGDRGRPAPGTRRVEGEGASGGRGGRREKSQGCSSGVSPGMCARPGERDQRGWKQAEDGRGEGAAGLWNPPGEAEGPASAGTWAAWLGFFIIIFKFLNPA